MTPQTPTAPPERFNFAQHLIERNATRGAKAAYIDDAETLTYAALADRVQRCAAGLHALGVRREERVLLLMHDCNDWPVSFLGALHAGIVPVAVNTLLRPAMTCRQPSLLPAPWCRSMSMRATHRRSMTLAATE